MSAPKTHYSAAELAAMKLPGYPTTRQGWFRIVKRESWEFKELKGPGRGGICREYAVPTKVAILIDTLPAMEARGTGSNITLTITVSLAEATHITRWLQRQARK